MYNNINSFIISSLIIKSHILTPFFNYSGKCMFTCVLNTGSSNIFFLINVNQKTQTIINDLYIFTVFRTFHFFGFPIFLQ